MILDWPVDHYSEMCVCWKGSNVYICVSSFSSLFWCRPVDHYSEDDHHCQRSNSNTSCQACGNDNNQEAYDMYPSACYYIAAVALISSPHPFWENRDTCSSNTSQFFRKGCGHETSSCTWLTSCLCFRVCPSLAKPDPSAQRKGLV